EFLTQAKGNGAVVVWLPSGRAGGVSPLISPVAEVIEFIEPLLKVSQALVAADAPGIALWLVTAGATIGHDAIVLPNLLQAPAAGMLRTIATELPGVACRLLDLDPTAPDDHVELALAEFWSPPPEDEIAYRRGKRFTNQLV